MTDAQLASKVIDTGLLELVSKEFGVSRADVEAMDDDTFADLYDKVADIEVGETMDSGEDELSEKGKAAEEFITLVGNAIYT